MTKVYQLQTTGHVHSIPLVLPEQAGNYLVQNTCFSVADVTSSSQFNASPPP